MIKKTPGRIIVRHAYSDKKLMKLNKDIECTLVKYPMGIGTGGREVMNCGEEVALIQSRFGPC